jgi:hypothetical protein
LLPRTSTVAKKKVQLQRHLSSISTIPQQLQLPLQQGGMYKASLLTIEGLRKAELSELLTPISSKFALEQAELKAAMLKGQWTLESVQWNTNLKYILSTDKSDR